MPYVFCNTYRMVNQYIPGAYYHFSCICGRLTGLLPMAQWNHMDSWAILQHFKTTYLYNCTYVTAAKVNQLTM